MIANGLNMKGLAIRSTSPLLVAVIPDSFSCFGVSYSISIVVVVCFGLVKIEG